MGASSGIQKRGKRESHLKFNIAVVLLSRIQKKKKREEERVI